MTSYEIAPCPVCRAQRARSLVDREEIKRELEALWQFHLRRLKPGAPIDELFDRAIFSQDPPLQVVECRDCGTVYRNPREREEEVLATYADETPSTEAFSSLFAQQYEFYQPRMRALANMRKAGSLLEVGSYLGAFLQTATDAGWQAQGIDVNETATTFARARGCAVHVCALDDYTPNQRFDVVALWNCFDQLPDPHVALGQVTRLLTEAGIIVIRVPNGACYARLRALPASLRRPLLAWNNLTSFPYRHGFTPASLRSLLHKHEYQVLEVRSDTLVSIASEWTRDWARREERLLKRAMLLLLPRRLAPWFEVYARRAPH